MKKIIRAFFWLFTPLILGSLVGFLIKNNIDYQTLIKPPFAPSNIIFPIAWTTIYLLMGISYYLLKKDSNNTLRESYIYYLQLIVNLLWSILYFLFKYRFLSIIWILLLVGLVINLIYLFWQKKRIAALLNIPYLLWILFATYLTIGIYFLNN